MSRSLGTNILQVSLWFGAVSATAFGFQGSGSSQGTGQQISAVEAAAISAALTDFRREISRPSEKTGKPDEFFGNLANYDVSVETRESGFVVRFHTNHTPSPVITNEQGRPQLSLFLGGDVVYTVARDTFKILEKHQIR